MEGTEGMPSGNRRINYSRLIQDLVDWISKCLSLAFSVDFLHHTISTH